MAVLAVQQIRRMRGGAQGHLMLGADSHLWVVKFQNNPQHVRVLANEMLATRLATLVGLPVPETAVVEVSPWLIENTAGLEMDLGRRREPCRPGLQFGARYVGGLMPGQVVDYLPEGQMEELRNPQDFWGVLAFDKWTGNVNGRQAVYLRRARERRYGAVFIDQGYCFHGGEWRFEDVPLRGCYPRNTVYAGVTGWEDFEPWLSRIASLTEEAIWQAAEDLPQEWCLSGSEGSESGRDGLDALEKLVETLIRRRSKVGELIDAFRRTDRNPFPKWGTKRG